MNEQELTTTERDYVLKLTDRERQVFLFDSNMLSKLRSVHNVAVEEFAAKSLLNTSLHNTHAEYNKLYDKYCAHVGSETADIEDALNATMRLTMSVGFNAAVVDLSNMDDCDAVYVLLSTLKMHAFDFMCDSFDIDDLFDSKA